MCHTHWILACLNLMFAELMQTELHHLQTLHIMAEVFRRGMKEEVQLDIETVERVFPCLDQLLVFHHAFFAAMKERRNSSARLQGHRNYLIQRIGDILLQQVGWSGTTYLFGVTYGTLWLCESVCVCTPTCHNIKTTDRSSEWHCLWLQYNVLVGNLGSWNSGGCFLFHKTHLNILDFSSKPPHDNSTSGWHPLIGVYHGCCWGN